MKMFSKEGVEMVDIKSITRDDQRLVIKGKVMGAMTTTILVNPEDCWQAARPVSYTHLDVYKRQCGHCPTPNSTTWK